MQVFISYSSRDRLDALKLKALVDELGHDAWMDVFDLRAGSPLTAELEAKVKQSGALLLLLSPFAIETRWVADEISYAREARQHGLRFVPIILRPTPIPDALGDLLAIDATRGLEDDTFRLRLAQALGGEIDEALVLDAETRAALADRALIDAAEAAFPGLRDDLEPFLDEPIRALRVVIDHRTYPTRERSIVEIRLQVDAFQGDASVFLAPYREGHTWFGEPKFDERPPEDFFGQTKARIDARFSFLGRTTAPSPVSNDSGWQERPLEFAIELDGSEFSGTERALTMRLAKRFELPPIRALMEKQSEVVLLRREPGAAASAVDPHATDLEIRLYADFTTDGVSRSLRLWSSRRSREEIALERSQTLAECRSPIEREILLDAFHPRPLREAENAPGRRERIGKALDEGTPLPEEDGWAAFRMMRSASAMMAFRGQLQPAARELHEALGRLPEDLALDRDPYGATFEYWHAVMRLAALLEKAGGADEALRFHTGEAVRVAEAAAEREPDEPDFRRAVARALIHRVEMFQRRFGTADPQDLARAEQIMDALAAEIALPWRAQEAAETREKTAALRRSLEAPASAPTSAPPVFARWLDPSARGSDEKLLLISRLLRYSAFLSERVPWSDPELQLVGKELVHVYRSAETLGFFCVSITETRSDAPKPPERDTVLQRAPLALVLSQGWRATQWEPTEQLGDLVARLELEHAHAVRMLLQRTEDDAALRVYLLGARTLELQWLVVLGLPSLGNDWRDVARDDASAAITFSRLNLG